MKYVLFFLLSSLTVHAETCFGGPQKPMQEITPDAAPRASRGVGSFATADFLYWSAHEGSLEYAVSNSVVNAPANGPIQSPAGKVYSLDWNWNPGLKAGVGYVFCRDGWDVYTEYTYFRSKTTGRTPSFASVNPSLQDAFWDVDLGTVLNKTYYSASAAWRLRLDTLDLSLGRSFYTSPYLKLRPFFGLKAALGRQAMKLRESVFGTAEVLTMRSRQRNEGLGIRGGFDAAWQFTDHWSLAGDLALTALWEYFQTSRLDDDSADPFQVSLVHFSNRFHTMKPVLEWMLGFRWETETSCGRAHTTVEAGWEQQIWFSQNQFLRHNNNTGEYPANFPGNLVLQGLTAKARVDF